LKVGRRAERLRFADVSNVKEYDDLARIVSRAEQSRIGLPRTISLATSFGGFFGVCAAMYAAAVLLSAGDRYKELVDRAKQGYGKFDSDSARRLMDCPVAMKSNLHDVLFAPKSTKFWIANASKDKRPAADQKYFAFQLTELLARRPEMTSPEIPLVAQVEQAQKN
jgi:hypothetical protein